MMVLREKSMDHAFAWLTAVTRWIKPPWFSFSVFRRILNFPAKTESQGAHFEIPFFNFNFQKF